MQIFHNKQTNGFCRTRTNSDTQSHKTGQQVGDTATFQKTEYHTPHATQWESIKKESKYIERPGKQTKQHKR